MSLLLLFADVVLQDFCDIVGTDLAGTHTRVWFRNVFTEGTESMSTCKDVEAPLTTQATKCVVATNAPTVASTTTPGQGSTNAPTIVSTKGPKTSATSRAPIFMAALFTIIVIIVG